MTDGHQEESGQPATIITFSQLIAEREKLVGDTDDDLNLSSFRNERTDLKKFMVFLGARAHDSIAVLTNGFDEKLEKYLANLETRGSVKPKRTRLTAWRSMAAEMAAAAAKEKTFHGLLSEQFIARKKVEPGLTITALARKAGMDGKGLKRWMSGRGHTRRNPSSYETIGRLEDALDLPRGTLLSKVEGRPAKARWVAKRSENPEENVHRFLNRIQIKKEWPEAYNSFFRKLVAFKGLGIVYNAAEEPIIDDPNPKRGWVKGTADIAEHFFGTMLAWLTLPVSEADARQLVEASGVDLADYGGSAFLKLVVPMFQGKGMAPDSLRPFHLFQPNLVSEHLAWRQVRAGGKVNHGHTQFLRCVIALLQPKFGFVVQQPEIGWDMPSLRLRALDVCDEAFSAAYEEQKRAWQVTCAKWLDSLNSMYGRYTGQRESTGTRGKLRSITDGSDPLAVLEILIDRHASVMPVGMPQKLHGGSRDAIWVRDHVLLLLMMSNPLRNRNVREMTWNRKDANLYRNDSGRWRLKYEKSEFKNDKGARKAPYDVEIPSRVVPYLDLYLSSGRPLLEKVGVAHKDRVFITERGTPFGDASSLSHLFAQLTGGFLTAIEGIEGFRSHAWRYIVATGFLKATGDFMTAALILHDEVETVLQHYAFLRPNDGFEKYERWLASRAGR